MEREDWRAPNGWYSRTPMPGNGPGGELTDNKIKRYARKGYYGEQVRRNTEAEIARERAERLAKKASCTS